MINVKRGMELKGSSFSSVKLIWALMKYKPGLYAANCLFWTMIHLMPLLPGVLTKMFFDHISNGAGVNSGVWGLLALLASVSAGRIACIYLGFRTDVLHRFYISSLLRINLVESILRHPGAVSLPYTSGEAVNCLRDDAYQAEESISWTLDVIGTAAFAVGAIAILISVNAKITVFVFAPLCLIVALAHFGSKHIKRFRNESRNATGKVTGAMGEMFQAVQAIQVAGAESHSVEYLRKLNDARHKSTLKDSLVTQILNSTFENTVSLGTGLILLLCSQLMREGSFTVGDFTLFIYYLAFVTDFTQFFGSFLAHFQQTGVSFKRMLLMLQEEPADCLVKSNDFNIKEDSLENIEGIKATIVEELDTLKVDQLTYRYPGDFHGIENVSFTIEKGTFNVICGRIGSGKSTLIKSLLGLLPMDSGAVFWNGRQIENPSTFFIPPISAYTAQVPKLFSDTVENNILFGSDCKGSVLAKAVNSAVLEEDIEKLENGLNTLVGPRGVKLSGGQIQRVAAARMFAKEAQVFVFDDISSALDTETEIKLWDRTLENRDRTCLVISNRRWALQKADQIIVLKDGRVEAQGTLQKLIESCEEFKKIWVE